MGEAHVFPAQVPGEFPSQLPLCETLWAVFGSWIRCPRAFCDPLAGDRAQAHLLVAVEGRVHDLRVVDAWSWAVSTRRDRVSGDALPPLLRDAWVTMCRGAQAFRCASVSIQLSTDSSGHSGMVMGRVIVPSLVRLPGDDLLLGPFPC